MIRIMGLLDQIKTELPEAMAKLKDGIYIATVKKWYKPRTTGEYSQNHHIHGHATQIGAEAGMTKDEVIQEAQEQALSKGYPAKLSPITGKIIPVSESELDTRGAAILIDQLHEIADFLSIKLKEWSPEELE